MNWPFIYIVFSVVFIGTTLLGCRLLHLILQKNVKISRRRSKPIKTLIILGSGGHTTEMLQIVKNLSFQDYLPRIYLHAKTDKISPAKMSEIEPKNNDVEIIEISRSREVGQSYLTSIWTTLISFKDSMSILWIINPDLILCNGPEEMCSKALLTASEIPWDTFVDNLRDNVPIEIKMLLMTMCNDLRSYCESDELLSPTRIEDSLLRLEACLDQTWEALNTGYWKDVSIKYRHSYTLCSAMKCIFLEIQCAAGERKSDMEKRDIYIEIINQIDKAILLGAPLVNALDLMTKMASKLNKSLADLSVEVEKFKEIAVDDSQIRKELLPGLVWIKRIERPSMESFYREIFMPKSPAVLEGCLDHWKALESWKSPNYLMKIAGNRTVPIEIGSRYTEEDWSQSLVTFAEFLRSHVTETNDKVGYLAQHQLFQQIPELKEDFTIPDYCNFSDTADDPISPDINAWFGPRGTVSPLHFDPKNNLLCQVFGFKRVILYHPKDGDCLYTYETRLLSNTAQVDPMNPDFNKYPNFKNARGSMCYLGPGEMLFIPPGWWHHVEALSSSFSISFWWS